MNHFTKKLSTAAVLFLFFYALSTAMTPEEAANEVTSCQKKVESVSALSEHYAALVGLLQPQGWSLASDEFETFVKGAQQKQQDINNRILQAGSRGHSLQNQIKNISENTCNPCLQSNIRHFCKNTTSLSQEIDSGIEEILKNVTDNASSYSAVFLKHAGETLVMAEEKLDEDTLKSGKSKLQEAEKFADSGKHSDAIRVCFEIVALTLEQ